MKDNFRNAVLFQLLSLPTIYSDLPTSGCYQLFLKIPEKLYIPVGALGKIFFHPGVYIYTGSQQQSVIPRMIRHLKPHKKLYWHIDYLTAKPEVKFSGMMIYFGEQEECYLNQSYRDFTRAQMPFSHFGSTDCKNGCGSHLLFLKSERLLRLSSWGELYLKRGNRSDCLYFF